MRFEWDDQKARSNLRKHGVAFEDAIRVFRDPLVVIQFDDHVDGEPRWRAIGLVDHINLLIVVHTTRHDEQGTEEITRIISARRAENRERRAYETA